MKNTTVMLTIRLDENLKKEFDLVCKDLGMTMNSAIVVYTKKVVREKRIPFEVSIGSSVDSTKREND